MGRIGGARFLVHRGIFFPGSASKFVFLYTEIAFCFAAIHDWLLDDMGCQIVDFSTINPSRQWGNLHLMRLVLWACWFFDEKIQGCKSEYDANECDWRKVAIP